uniref:N-acetyltransferase domain-containing protein n=1 Tax=Psilocybe cubensis TaxID=181762 RepID=A0A8H7Y4C3_PSICU
MPAFTVQRVQNPTGRKTSFLHGVIRSDSIRSSEEEINASADLFYDLMQDNQGAISLSGGDKSLMKLQALAMLRAGILAGEYYTATNKDGKLIGYTLWMPPGREIFSTEEERQLGFNEFMARLPDQGKEYFRTTFLAHFPGFVNSILGPTVGFTQDIALIVNEHGLSVYPQGKLDSWWLHMAMVDRNYQKMGITRALINLVREKASVSGDTLACSTTNDNNVPVYLALGFTHRGRKIMPSPWGDWPVHLFSLDTSLTS